VHLQCKAQAWAAMRYGKFWTQMDPERKTAQEWSLLSRVMSYKKYYAVFAFQ